MKREFLVSVSHPKAGAIFWTCVKYHIIDEKQDYKVIGLQGFDNKIFEEEGGGGNRKGLGGYPYLKHIIQLWPGYWVQKVAKMNEAFFLKNCFTMYGGWRRLVCPFRRQQFSKCIGCVLSAFTYWKKGHKLWIETQKAYFMMSPTEL